MKPRERIEARAEELYAERLKEVLAGDRQPAEKLLYAEAKLEAVVEYLDERHDIAVRRVALAGVFAGTANTPIALINQLLETAGLQTRVRKDDSIAITFDAVKAEAKELGLLP